MEFSRELDLGFNSLIVAAKGVLSQHDAELILTGIFSFVLILHIRVHVSIEEHLVILILELEFNSLVWRPSHFD